MPNSVVVKDEKYVVFKTAELKEWATKFHEGMRRAVYGDPNAADGIPSLMDLALPDATVIRAQDIFAGPGLTAYANGIMVAVMAMKAERSEAGYNDKVTDSLERIADYFHQRAEEAWETEYKKIPD